MKKKHQIKPIIIAHRGASGYRPEHTLAAYKLAIDMGADFIEPSLVMTKDGVFIARHENEISATTDISMHPEFSERYTVKEIDGKTVKGWFTEDFTLAEIKSLRAKERIPHIRPQNIVYDRLYSIPTLQEIIDLVQNKNREKENKVGIYLETKHPTYFHNIGLPLEEPLIETLHQSGYHGKQAPIFIQSFEVANLKKISRLTNLPLAQLINNNGKPYDFIDIEDNRTYNDLISAKGLQKITKYATAIGIHKDLLIPRNSSHKLLSPTPLVSNAHGVKLLVHAWSFRNEDIFLPLDFQGNPQGECELFIKLGIDGVFSDYPDTALRTIYLDI